MCQGRKPHNICCISSPGPAKLQRDLRQGGGNSIQTNMDAPRGSAGSFTLYEFQQKEIIGLFRQSQL